MLPKRPSSSGIILLIWFSLLPLPVSADGDLRARLEQLRYQSVPTILGVPLASARLLDDFYYQRNDRFVWDRNQRVEDLLRLVEQSADEGFQPGDFHVQKIRDIAADRPSLRLFASASADEEILLSDSLLRLIHHRRYGKIDPKRLDRNWNYAGPYAHDLLEDLERAVRAQNLPAEVEGLTAQPAFHTRLQQGLVRYRRIAATGGWPRLPAGKPLRPSASDPRVPILRKRLQATGDYKGPASTSPVYDAALATAVRTFQKRHRLESKGIVGTKTRAAMNVPVTRRIDQIRINLERMRWLSDRLPDDFLLVDIVEQKAELFRNGRVIWDSRVIVGRSKRPTPMFRDQVEYLEINPGWIVPPTILKKDILPAARKNPNSLKKKGLQVITRDGKPVSPQSVNWNRSPANFPYLIRQPPRSPERLGPDQIHVSQPVRRLPARYPEPGPLQPLATPAQLRLRARRASLETRGADSGRPRPLEPGTIPADSRHPTHPPGAPGRTPDNHSGLLDGDRGPKRQGPVPARHLQARCHPTAGPRQT